MRFALVAGETSGDLLAAGLIDALRRRVPDARFEGVAGPAMLAAGCERVADADELAVMGLVEPLRRVPRLLALRRSLIRRWREQPPAAFVGIDAPDFNLGLELALRRAGVPTVHYVSPSVWAWRARRVHKIRKAVDCVLCLLPFEKAFYDRHDVRAVFVGHPKADRVGDAMTASAARQALGLADAAAIVAVLPGSRMSEVRRLGPVFSAAAARIRSLHPDVQFVTPVAKPSLRSIIEQQLASDNVRDAFELLDGDSATAMAAADVVLLASGTAALEAALLARPTVAAYRVAPLTSFLVRRLGLLKVDRFTLPNLLTKEAYIPEFIQERASPANLAEAVVALLDDPARRAEIAARFATLRSELALGADERAAEAVLAVANDAAKHSLSA
ncbi:MAG: lipid-A-disaccharide synthase [Woeseiaceae bacterium]|nr:lipid-A-disaccharide synthase [Woeseiaceae bacterium]